MDNCQYVEAINRYIPNTDTNINNIVMSAQEHLYLSHGSWKILFVIRQSHLNDFA